MVKSGGSVCRGSQLADAARSAVGSTQPTPPGVGERLPQRDATASGRCVLITVGAVALSLALALVVGSLIPAGAKAPKVSASYPERESFVHQFAPNTGPWVFTFTIPIENADPWDVEVVSGASHVDVWFTASGADQIGRLVYTDTSDYAFYTHTLASGSRPLNLVSGGGFIWFTAAEGDYIGRLNPTTGEIDEFEVTVGSYPADLDVAPDGSVWFTQMETDRIAHLLVTSAAHYTVIEYYGPSLSGGQPYGIVVVGADIYFAQTAKDRVTCFRPPDSWVHIQGFVPGLPDEPYALVVDGLGYVWGTELSGNRVSLFDFGTFPIVVPYSLSPSDSLPTDIAVDPSDSLWFTQRGAGQIGRLIRSVPPQKDYYPLPLRGLAPTGIAVDSGGAAWTVSSSDSGGDSFIHRFDPERLFRLFLPIAMKESAQ